MSARELAGVKLAAVLWWPHSGGRWLCRSLISAHPRVYQTVFAHPWVFFTSDDVLDLDNTTQVHKTRSLPDLAPHLRALISSTNEGRRAGLMEYFGAARRAFDATTQSFDWVIGELCMGTPVPRIPDLQVLFESCPDLMLVHLVRSPVGCFPSFANRFELCADPARVAGSWVASMAAVRCFFERHPKLASQHHTVKYEDLVSNPRQELEEIFRFLGIDFSDSMTLKVEERWGRRSSDDIDADDRATILDIASPEMKNYGYE